MEKDEKKTMFYKTLHGKDKIEQHDPTKNIKQGMDLVAPNR